MRQECDGRNSLQQDKEKEEYCRMKRAEEAMATMLHERPERGFKCNTEALLRSSAPTHNTAAVLRSNGKQRNANTAGIRSQAKKTRRRPLQ
jgi:hypothetical protein